MGYVLYRSWFRVESININTITLNIDRKANLEIPSLLASARVFFFQYPHSFRSNAMFRKNIVVFAILAPLIYACSGDNDTDDSTGLTSSDAPVESTETTQTPQDSMLVQSDSPIIGTCIDTPPENDGWGWNGTSSCQLNTSSQVSQEGLQQITDVVLVTGQSNTLGSNTEVVEGLDDPSERVYAWTENGWDIANLRQVWDLGWHPRTTPDGLHPHNNFALHFGKRVASGSERILAFIVLSAAGRPISHWDNDKGFYRKIVYQVNEALSHIPHINELNAILWHQGENNWFGGAEYREKLNALIANFRSEPWYGETALFICGETHRAPVNVDLNSLNSDGDLRTACVSSLGVSVRPDLTHFDASGLREIGKRYGDKYMAIYNGDVSSN